LHGDIGSNLGWRSHPPPLLEGDATDRRELGALLVQADQMQLDGHKLAVVHMQDRFAILERRQLHKVRVDRASAVAVVINPDGV
jgi:hypothetical protein